MTLRIRKLLLLAALAGVFLTANALLIARWLNDAGVIAAADTFRQEFLTGTAITVLLALVVLLVEPRTAVGSRRCPVCDRRAGGAYCSSCGSRTAG